MRILHLISSSGFLRNQCAVVRPGTAPADGERETTFSCESMARQYLAFYQAVGVERLC